VPEKYWTMATNLALVERALRQTGKDVPPVLMDVCGTDMNAQSLRVGETDQYVLLFSGGLSSFTELMTDIVSNAWMQPPGSFLQFVHYFVVDEAIKNKDYLSQQLARILIAIIARQDVEAARLYASPTLVHDFTLKLGMCTQFFVIAHEMAHMIEGHLSGRPAPEAGIHVFSTVDGTELKIPEKTQARWNEECQADNLALRLLLQLCGSINLPMDIGYAGAELCIGAAEALDRAIWIIKQGNIDRPARSTHPPPYLRREMLRKSAGSAWPASMPMAHRPGYTDQLLAIGQLLQYVVEVLFDGALRYLLLEHHK
jgi:hypothetical protein